MIVWLAAGGKVRAFVRIVKKVFWALFGVFVIFGLLLLGTEKGALIFAPTNKLGYFLKYSTLVGFSGEWKVATWDQVFVERRPHDCEWGTAPPGSKHCRYDPLIHTVCTGTDEKGKPIVSYDEGKTSQAGTSPSEAPAVYVTWEKIEE